ncbi:oligopeptide/dipeptide ABC transporter ATP-binding protein [Sphaerimonospora mesophila]|uniref:ABC transporter ATP-binding protein n=1 Tax=Sphaerimonospora mesophila TaxID=37483 RepID=UPI0006E1A4E1
MAGSGTAHLRDDEDVLLRVEDLLVEYPARAGLKVQAVAGISFDIRRCETLGFVGESGCGKSTTGRALLQLPSPTAGSVLVDGKDLTRLSPRDMRRERTKLQMIFQDPISSLNPRRRIRESVREPLAIWDRDHGDGLEKVARVLDQVGLDSATVGDRYPSELSGGQCQRIAIARALIMEPALLICDEPVSALDVSVQAQILNLLEDLKEQYGLSMMFIAHDLAVVKNISDRVAVMYLGKLCEIADANAIVKRPAHPYTRELISAVPVPDATIRRRSEEKAPAEVPSPLNPPSGCRFRTRCSRAEAVCAVEEPQFQKVDDGHFVACHFPLRGMPMVRTTTEAVGV